MPKRSGQSNWPRQGSHRLLELVGLLRLISGTTRVEIILLLADGQLWVLELARLTEFRQVTASIQLAHLRAAGVVESERQGRAVHYRLTETGERIARLIESLAEGSHRPS